MGQRERGGDGERLRDVDVATRRPPPRSPSDMFSVKVRCLSTDEGFEGPLQDCGPIEVPFVVHHPVHPLAVFIYGTRCGTRNPFALDKPRSKIWPMSDGIKGLPPKAAVSLLETTGGGKLTRNYGSGKRKSL